MLSHSVIRSAFNAGYIHDIVMLHLLLLVMISTSQEMQCSLYIHVHNIGSIDNQLLVYYVLTVVTASVKARKRAPENARKKFEGRGRLRPVKILKIT
jgi:hypothetical protein